MSNMRTARMRWPEMRLLCRFFHEQTLGSRALVVYQMTLEVGAYLQEEWQRTACNAGPRIKVL
jgi:hypothetical protein